MKSPWGKFALGAKTGKQRAIALCIILSTLSIIAITSFLIINKSDPPQTPVVSAEPAITFSTDSPDESKDNAKSYKWRGAPDEPKKIKIPKLSIDAYVQKAGVDQNKKVAVPNNVHLAGWFADSQKPGQNGLVIIAGHVSGRKSDGVFKQLGKLVQGDTFEVELGSRKKLNFKVIETNQYREAESANYLFSQNPKVKSQINLITCGGSYDEKARSYEDRVIVSAELIS